MGVMSMSLSTKQVIPITRMELVSSEAVTQNATAKKGCRGLRVGQAGTLNISFKNGFQADGIPFTVGDHPMFLSAVRSGGDAENIWFLY